MKIEDYITGVTYGRMGYKWFQVEGMELNYSLEEGVRSGCSCIFYPMNSEVNKEDSFALKSFDKVEECLASYQRQYRAFQEGLAPPVGSLFLVTRVDKRSNIAYTRGAYQTARAQQLDENTKSVLTGIRHSRLSQVPFVQNLRRSLRRVNLTGTLLNDIFASEKDVLVPSGSGICLGGDLHASNFMLWQGRHVCIDFGVHSVLTSPRGRCAALYDWMVPGCKAAQRTAAELGFHSTYKC
jgi:hypothetical protein